MKTFKTHIDEGTWALPDTQKKYDELMKLMKRPIPAGKATKILYNFAGDDALFDAIGEKEKEDKNGDVRPMVNHFLDLPASRKYMKKHGIKGVFANKEEVEIDEANLNDYAAKFKQKMGKTTYQTMTDWVDGIGGLTKREASTLKLKLKPFTEEIKLDEGRMSDLHLLIKQGKSAEEIAKIMKVDVKTIKTLMNDFRESARSDALRSIRRDKDLGKRSDVEADDSATDADIKGASKNIIMQMRKVVSLNGRFAVEFEDKKKVKIPVNIGVAVQQKFDSFRKPIDKEKFQAKVAKSYKSMLTALKENKTILDRISKKIQERKNG